MLKGYKTVIINILLAVIPVLDGVDVTHILNPTNQSIYMLVVPLINLILRFYTTSPVFNKNVTTSLTP